MGREGGGAFVSACLRMRDCYHGVRTIYGVNRKIENSEVAR